MKRPLAALLPLLLLSSVATGATAPDADPKIAFEKYTLPNGVEIILHEDHRVPLVAVDVWYHVGSGDETYGKSGFAHLFEHMMFQGSQHVGEDKHFDILKKIGASGVNGSTNTERTNYYEVVPAQQIETALWLESDRMGWLLELLNQPSLDNQRDVVRNERRQRYDNVPYGKDRFAAAAALYPEGHSHRYLTIGLHEDLEKASVDDVKGFFRKWYVPANATVTIAGDFDPAKTKALVEKWFGTFPKTEKPAHRTNVFTPLNHATPSLQSAAGEQPWRTSIEDPFAKLRRVHYEWISPGTYQPGDAELDLLGSVLSREGTGRLYKLLVHDKELAQSVSASQNSPGHAFHLSVELKTGADMAEVEKILDAELDRVRSEPISDRELKRAVTGVETGFIWGLEGLMARAELLQGYNHLTGDPGYVSKDLARYRSATPATIQEAAVKWLAKESRAEIITTPAAKAEKGGAK